MRFFRLKYRRNSDQISPSTALPHLSRNKHKTLNREDDQLHSLAGAQPAMLEERKRKVFRKVLSHEGLRSSSALSGSIAAHRARARFLFCERARSGMPTCKHSTSPPSRELGNVEPGEAPAKNCFARTATQTVWCAKTGTALNDERDSGSFESPHPPAGYPSIRALVNSLRMFNVRKVVTNEKRQVQISIKA